MPSGPLVVVLVGPTASGKTALLDELFGSAASRERYGLPEAQVVSADSMQAYRGMDIGTAKPDAALLSRLPHRLIDILDISEQYTVGDFVRLADAACLEISESGMLPIVSGGTGFYARNFICGLPTAPAADPAMRAAVARDLRERGEAALREELAAADPGSAARIHANDLYRLTRALEITRATGRPMADFAAGAAPRRTFSFAVVGVSCDQAELAARIGARVDAMVAAGLREEVAALLAAGHAPGEPGMRAIGYREFLDDWAALGARAGSETAVIAERIKRNTRRYAKRQMTFFRNLPGIRWIGRDPGALAALLSSIVRSGENGL